GDDVAAVVSRGGRPDLAGERLAAVRAPTLLIVGGSDDLVLDLNRRAEALLRCESRLEVVPGGGGAGGGARGRARVRAGGGAPARALARPR
ncbi:hypothetical protein ACFV5C_15475, partial [Streptomyces sp. NPDC059762]